MKTLHLKRQRFFLILTVLMSHFFASCSKNDEAAPEATAPTVENIEIGYGNNEQGIIGRDFHLDMDIVAGEQINDVQVLIKQRASETYSNTWSFEITWIEFRGTKNTNVHKHFDIDKEAPEGIYDFIIRVSDKNGSVKEEKRSIKLIKPENLDADPELYSLLLQKDGKDFVYIFNVGYPNPDDKGFKKNEKLQSYVDISAVKGDGVLYSVLIKKNAGHLPETVDDIDLSKVIVADITEHKNMTAVDYFNNYVAFDFKPKELIIGASVDNNSPSPNAIQGNKAWENGKYYFGVIYTNTTYKMSTHYYTEIDLTGF